MPKDKRVKGCPNINCSLHIKKKKQKADVEYCPECGEKLIYVCKVCFREIQDSGLKHNTCRLCEVEKMEKKEKAVQTAKDIAGKGVKTVVGLGVTIGAAVYSKESKELINVAVKHSDRLIKDSLKMVFKK